MARLQSPRAALGILTGLNFLNYLDRYIVAAVLPRIQKDLSLSDFEGGLLATVFLLGYFVTAPIFGTLGDRMPRKWLIALGVKASKLDELGWKKNVPTWADIASAAAGTRRVSALMEFFNRWIINR